MSRVSLLPASLLLLAACTVAQADAVVDPPRRYQAAVEQLDAFIAREVAAKDIPALSIALVDDRAVVWAKGFGFADPTTKKPATADTVYRVGSVSKLFTDLAVMQLVERGVLDLDAPVAKYVPDFKPISRYEKAITLRQLMAHRAGLVREPSVGNTFDPNAPSLSATVSSLNKTELVYEPGSRTKYSNAAITAVGLVLQETHKQAFARSISRTLLTPLGMKSSSFEPEPTLIANLAKGTMWTYHGREFPAPTFELGTMPAACLYSTANDMARFLAALFASGKGPTGEVIRAETLEQMWKPQFPVPGEAAGYGIGFVVGKIDGRRAVGHAGAAYGFATDLLALPDDKLGVIVLASRDSANALTERIARAALALMLAAKNDKPLPTLEVSASLKPEQARKLAGRYAVGAKSFELEEFGGRLWLVQSSGGTRAEVRALGNDLLVDDRVRYGPKIIADGDRLKIGADTYVRVAADKPAPLPAKWLGLIGEYGWDHSTLFILEKDHKLHALIEWLLLYPLDEESADSFKFPDDSLYAGERIVFVRDKARRATLATAAGIPFERRKLDGENGETFRIKPIRPLDVLRREALAATPPLEKGEFRKPDLVDITKLDKTIRLDVRYASDNNFLSMPFYASAQAFMQRPAAEALVRVHRQLEASGFGLLVFDGYRPWSVTKMFWEATPEKNRIFVADPAKGSRHNRGCAVDLTLCDRKTGKPIDMVGGYDEMSDRSYPQYVGGTSLQRWHREHLRRAMEAEGFTVYEAEWWHFDYKDWRQYPILNKDFKELTEGR